MAKVMLCAKCGIAPMYESGSVPCPDGIAGCLVHHATIVPCRACELLASLATLREENARLEGQAIAALSDKIMRHETPDSRIARRDRRIAELEAEREAVRNALRRVLDANGNMINTRTNND